MAGRLLHAFVVARRGWGDGRGLQRHPEHRLMRLHGRRGSLGLRLLRLRGRVGRLRLRGRVGLRLLRLRGRVGLRRLRLRGRDGDALPCHPDHRAFRIQGASLWLRLRLGPGLLLRLRRRLRLGPGLRLRGELRLLLRLRLWLRLRRERRLRLRGGSPCGAGHHRLLELRLVRDGRQRLATAGAEGCPSIGGPSASRAGRHGRAL